MHVFASSQLPPLQYLTQPLSPSSLPTFYISFLLSSFILWLNLLFWSSSLFLSVCCHFILHSSFSHSLEWKCIKKTSQMLQILTNIQCLSLQFFYCPSAFLPSFFHSSCFSCPLTNPFVYRRLWVIIFVCKGTSLSPVMHFSCRKTKGQQHHWLPIGLYIQVSVPPLTEK